VLNFADPRHHLAQLIIGEARERFKHDRFVTCCRKAS
jgi:hypothetical protein